MEMRNNGTRQVKMTSVRWRDLKLSRSDESLAIEVLVDDLVSNRRWIASRPRKLRRFPNTRCTAGTERCLSARPVACGTFSYWRAEKKTRQRTFTLVAVLSFHSSCMETARDFEPFLAFGANLPTKKNHKKGAIDPGNSGLSQLKSQSELNENVKPSELHPI